MSTNYLRNKYINDNLRPGGRYLAIFTANPNFTTAAGGTQASGGSYARKLIAFTDPDSTPGITEHTALIEWTAGTDINAATYTGFAIYDDLTAGNMLFGKAFATNRVLAVAGDILRFPAGSIDYTIT